MISALFFKHMQEFKSFEELEQAYKTLQQEVAQLKHEWREAGVVETVNSIECEFLEEQTAKEASKFNILAVSFTRYTLVNSLYLISLS